jgi:amino acid permease
MANDDEILAIFSFLALFVFSMLLFPYLNEAIIAATPTGLFAPLYPAIPYLFIAASIVPMVYFIYRRLEK